VNGQKLSKTKSNALTEKVRVVAEGILAQELQDLKVLLDQLAHKEMKDHRVHKETKDLRETQA
jgi:hypothetical protein